MCVSPAHPILNPNIHCLCPNGHPFGWQSAPSPVGHHPILDGLTLCPYNCSCGCQPKQQRRGREEVPKANGLGDLRGGQAWQKIIDSLGKNKGPVKVNTFWGLPNDGGTKQDKQWKRWPFDAFRSGFFKKNCAMIGKKSTDFYLHKKWMEKLERSEKWWIDTK